MSKESFALGVQTDLLRHHGFMPPPDQPERFYRRFRGDDYELFASIVAQGTCMSRLGSEDRAGEYVHVVPFGIALTPDGILTCRKAVDKANGLSGKLSIDIGGNIDFEDGKDPMRSLKREVGEEALVYDEFGVPVEMRADETRRPGNGNANIEMIDELLNVTPLGVVYDGSEWFNPNYIGMPVAIETVNPGHRIALNPFNDEADWSGYISYGDIERFFHSGQFTAANWPDIVITHELARLEAIGTGKPSEWVYP